MLKSKEKNTNINLKGKVINSKEGKVIPLGNLGYFKLKLTINDDLLLIPMGGRPSTMLIQKGKYIL